MKTIQHLNKTRSSVRENNLELDQTIMFKLEPISAVAFTYINTGVEGMKNQSVTSN